MTDFKYNVDENVFLARRTAELEQNIDPGEHVVAVDRRGSAEATAMMEGFILPGHAILIGRNGGSNGKCSFERPGDITAGELPIVEEVYPVDKFIGTVGTAIPAEQSNYRKGISNEHCLVVNGPEGYELIDLSSGGTHLNGVKIEKGEHVLMSPGPNEISILKGARGDVGLILEVPDNNNPYADL